MEHTQANPKTHTCGMCGYEWLHGQHGGHDCATRLKAQRDELLAGLQKHVDRTVEVAQELKEPRLSVDTTRLISVRLLAEAAKDSMDLLAKHKEASHG